MSYARGDSQLHKSPVHAIIITEMSWDPPRKHPRIRPPSILEVFAESGGFQVRQVVDNISRGGLFIRTAAPPPPGTTLKLILSIPGQGPPGRATAEVVWITPKDQRFRLPGMGLRFVKLDQRALAILNTVEAMAMSTVEPFDQVETTALEDGGQLTPITAEDVFSPPNEDRKEFEEFQEEYPDLLDNLGIPDEEPNLPPTGGWPPKRKRGLAIGALLLVAAAVAFFLTMAIRKHSTKTILEAGPKPALEAGYATNTPGGTQFTPTPHYLQASPSPERMASKLEKISWTFGTDGSEVVKLEGDGKLKLAGPLLRLHDPERLVIRLAGIKTRFPNSKVALPLKFAHSARVWLHDELDPPQLFVVLDLTARDVHHSVEIGGSQIAVRLIAAKQASNPK